MPTSHAPHPAPARPAPADTGLERAREREESALDNVREGYDDPPDWPDLPARGPGDAPRPPAPGRKDAGAPA